MPLSVGTRLGPYEILAPIGAGGMGKIYRARDTRLRRDVAIKIAAEQFTERFEREARADGTVLNSSFMTRYDGTEWVVEGSSPFDRIALKQLDASTFVDERKKKDGLFHAKVRTLISKDGKTLTTVATGTNSEGKPFTSTLVHERQ